MGFHEGIVRKHALDDDVNKAVLFHRRCWLNTGCAAKSVKRDRRSLCHPLKGTGTFRTPLLFPGLRRLVYLVRRGAVPRAEHNII